MLCLWDTGLQGPGIWLADFPIQIGGKVWLYVLDNKIPGIIEYLGTVETEDTYSL